MIQQYPCLYTEVHTNPMVGLLMVLFYIIHDTHIILPRISFRHWYELHSLMSWTLHIFHKSCGSAKSSRYIAYLFYRSHHTSTKSWWYDLYALSIFICSYLVSQLVLDMILVSILFVHDLIITFTDQFQEWLAVYKLLKL